VLIVEDNGGVHVDEPLPSRRGILGFRLYARTRGARGGELTIDSTPVVLRRSSFACSLLSACERESGDAAQTAKLERGSFSRADDFRSHADHNGALSRRGGIDDVSIHAAIRRGVCDAFVSTAFRFQAGQRYALHLVFTCRKFSSGQVAFQENEFKLEQGFRRACAILAPQQTAWPTLCSPLSSWCSRIFSAGIGRDST
jgi:hypothetical protein